VCHGLNSEETAVAPHLWGPYSFNNGAGMARIHTLAAFIRQNMPRDQGDTLTKDEAYDLAAFISSQPRPDFPDRIHDYPKGHEPDEAPLF
jgi:thiosulfate dehydrogenase